MDRAESGPVECRAARDYLVTVIMQKLAVQWRSTLSSVGHSRVLVECQSTLYALPRSTRLYRVECRRFTPQLVRRQQTEADAEGSVWDQCWLASREAADSMDSSPLYTCCFV